MTGSLIRRKTSSGKVWFYVQISYKDPISGKWKSKCYSTGIEDKPGNKRRANAKIEEGLQKYAYLENAPAESENCDPDVTLEDYITLWLEGKKNELRTSTYEGYEYRVNIIKCTLGKKGYKVRELTPAILDSYLSYMLKSGKRNQKTGEKEPLSVRSVRSYRSLLNAVCDKAVVDGLIKSNPLQSVKVRGKKNSEYSDGYVFLTETEIGEFLHFLKGHYPFLVEVAFLGAYYGLRRSEILGLKWDAIDYEHGYIRIECTKVRVHKIQVNKLTKTNASRRDLNLFPTAEKCFKSLEEQQERDRAFYGNAYRNQEGYVIVNEEGKPYNPNYISKVFHKATKEFGRPEVTLHKLRHSCASMLIEKGWDVKRAQYWLGHNDINCTLAIYAHYDKHKLNRNGNDLAAISEVVSDLFE